MSLLSICQNAADTIGVTRPTFVIGNTDINVRRLLAMAQREGADLRRRYRWQRTIRQASLTTVATESQGIITTLAPGYDQIIADTAWDRTQQRPLQVLTNEQYQARKASVVAGPWNMIYIFGNLLNSSPVPAAGLNWVFDYWSTYFCQSNASADQSSWLADTDTGILDEEIMTLGVIYRYKQSNGLDYAQDMIYYETQVADAMARDGGKSWIDMSEIPYRFEGGLIIQAGSWPLP